MSKITLGDIRATYTDKKRAFDRENLYVYLVMRPLSWFPTWVCLKLGVTANGATWIGLGIGICAAAALAWGGYWGGVAGAFLYNLFFLFDHIDGNIARFHRTTNHYGKFLDGVFGAFLGMLVYLATGIGLGWRAVPPWDTVTLAAGAVAATALVFRLYLASRLDLQIMQLPKEVKTASEVAAESAADISAPSPSLMKSVRNLLINLEHSSTEASLLIFAIAGQLRFWILIYAALVCANSFLDAARVLRQASKKLDFYRPF